MRLINQLVAEAIQAKMELIAHYSKEYAAYKELAEDAALHRDILQGELDELQTYEHTHT